jgi:DNA-binding NarL/FixJ family response regulator
MIGRPRLLIADCAPMRLGIRIALEGRAAICAEADDAARAIRAAKREQPDICLVGRDIPGDGLAAVRGISRAAPDSAVLVLVETMDVDELLDLIRAGAVGYVPGPVDAERLRRIIKAVEAKEAVVPRAMVHELLVELRGASNGGEGLTGREAQVFRMVRRGHSTAAIAERLEIAPGTVRRHISVVVHKLGVDSRSALINSAW